MKSLGNRGEDHAAKFLKGKGYRLISRNFKTSIGEIDIIAEDKGTLVFIEVKTRTDNSFGHPFEALTYRKREKIKKVALCYLKNLKKPVAARFDVMSIEMDGDEPVIELIVDAFE
jgi:putative endonuclease